MSSRREFLSGVAAAGLLSGSPHAAPALPMSVKVVAFDAFPILDPRPVYALCEQLFPVKGAELAALWRSRQFEYMWLRTLSRDYADFLSLTADALVFAARSLKLELSEPNRARLMDAWLRLTCWPDVPPALKSLSDSGLRLGFLSNMSAAMLEGGLRNSGLTSLFEQVLSTDRVRAYKPDPRAYHLALDAFRVRRREIVFAAFAGWDAAGATKFGYRTFWVNRQNQPAEELGTAPCAAGPGMHDLVAYLLGHQASAPSRETPDENAALTGPRAV